MKAKLSFLLLTLVLFLAACGGTPSTPTPDQQGLPQEAASDLKELTLNSSDYLFGYAQTTYRHCTFGC